MTERTPPHSCGGCPKRWWGASLAHCGGAGCHETFSGVTTFDAHRRDGRRDGRYCLNPKSIGMAQDKHGVWGNRDVS